MAELQVKHARQQHVRVRTLEIGLNVRDLQICDSADAIYTVLQACVLVEADFSRGMNRDLDGQPVDNTIIIELVYTPFAPSPKSHNRRACVPNEVPFLVVVSGHVHLGHCR